MTNFLSVFKLDLKLNFQSLLGDKSKMAKRIGLLVLLLVAFAIPLALIFVTLYFMAQVAVLFGGFADELINLVFISHVLTLAFVIYFISFYCIISIIIVVFYCNFARCLFTIFFTSANSSFRK